MRLSLRRSDIDRMRPTHPTAGPRRHSTRAETLFLGAFSGALPGMQFAPWRRMRRLPNRAEVGSAHHRPSGLLRRLSSLALAGAVAGLVACGTKPTTSAPSLATDPTGGGATCDPAPTCNASDRQVVACPDPESCYEVGCGSQSIKCERCPCPDGEVKVMGCGDSPGCHPVFVCGQDIWCQGACHPQVCKPGDFQVDHGCPKDATCYGIDICYPTGFGLCAVGSTCHPAACDPGDTPTGTTDCATVGCYVQFGCSDSIACFDSTLPEHFCPDSPPQMYASCPYQSLVCHYPTSPGCVDTFTCVDSGGLEWMAGGEVCQ